MAENKAQNTQKNTQKKDADRKKDARNRKRMGNQREIWLSAGSIGVLFLCLLVYLGHFVATSEQDMINNSYNSRQQILLSRNYRGSIYSRDGDVLAETILDADEEETRNYPYKNLFSHIVGYSTQGRMGVEALANEGSAAAPTAGLHFTQELLQQIADKGIKIAYVTLHVGLGTFRPVKEENVLEHHMHSEYYQVTEEAANTINETKKNGGRVICVGTTSCRTVESAADEQGMVQPGCDNTEIFIYPGYRFKVLDALITNFHLPESTLVMLVSALAGREHILHAYEEAIREKYRFFSFGDAMFIADLKGEK